MTPGATQVAKQALPLGQYRRPLKVNHFSMTIAAGGLHEIAMKNWLIDFRGLVHFMMRSVGMRGWRSRHPLTQVTPSASGSFRRVLIDENIKVGMGFERFLVIFVVGIFVRNMAGHAPVDPVNDLRKIILGKTWDDGLLHGSRLPKERKRFIKIHGPLCSFPVSGKVSQFLIKLILSDFQGKKFVLDFL